MSTVSQQTKWRQALLSGALILQSLLLANGQATTALNEPCLAFVKDIFSEDRQQLLCQTPSGMLYILPSVDGQWIEEKMIAGELYSGETILDLPDGTTINREDQTLNLNEMPALVNSDSSERRLQQNTKTTGDRTVLAVRVIASNGEMSKSDEELSASIFGGANDFVNLKSQYAACSHGKINIVKRPDMNGLTSNIQNGVVTIRVNLPVEVGHSTMVNAVSQELDREFGMTMHSIADHVMYCLPKGNYNGVGFAIMNGGLSVFNDKLCTSVSTQMHEIGHNLNLGHSGIGTEKYGDQSCMMGYSYRSSEAPKMCFNAAKSFQLGWYDDKSKSMIPGTGPWGDDHTFTLSNIVDYPTTNDDVLIEIVEPASQKNYYVGFNVGKGFNQGTRHGKNQVLVYSKPVAAGIDSLRVADLSSGDSFTISDFNGITGNTLSISVLSIDLSSDLAQVRVTLNRKHSPPTPMPTRYPTPAPTRLPTRRPTPSPTLRPVAQTPSPTRPIGGRKPTVDDIPVTTSQSCKAAYSECETTSECCAGFSCRRVASDTGFSNVCRAIAKNSKDKLQRNGTPWWKRRLRGDSNVQAPREPDNEILEVQA
ncbi:unnamed protein product [Cylindrotheca closterium]|uniref:Peptidase M11 gametolysin domain-containing protein n=1 Tax=Cylindrotheca closterium TaxID=2856 RepID=A0AAD2FVE2_9STRA|nr:unnamed protein product [Cylindrotheca closterium]